MNAWPCGIAQMSAANVYSCTDFATDPYATLGVQSSASLATIKSAWKVAALKYHPDKCGDDGTRFRAVQAAWEVLREKGARPPMKGAKGSQFNAARARHAKDSELRAAAQTADFDAKARAFVARQQAKKREYEATEEGQTKSPADAMKARNQARLEARYKQMMDQREAHQASTADSSAASGLEPGRTKGPMWTNHQHERSTSTAFAPPTRAEELRAAHREGAVANAVTSSGSSGCDARAVEIASAFLTHPANASEPLEARVAFVLQQGVDEKNVREALRRAGWTSFETGTGGVAPGSALYEA